MITQYLIKVDQNTFENLSTLFCPILRVFIVFIAILCKSFGSQLQIQILKPEEVYRHIETQK